MPDNHAPSTGNTAVTGNEQVTDVWVGRTVVLDTGLPAIITSASRDRTCDRLRLRLRSHRGDTIAVDAWRVACVLDTGNVTV